MQWPKNMQLIDANAVYPLDSAQPAQVVFLFSVTTFCPCTYADDKRK